jgi:hypothetical protein
MRHMLIAAAVCLAGAVLFGFLARHSTRFERNGVTGQATVTGKVNKQTDRGIFYALEIQYVVDGVEHQRMRGVMAPMFERVKRGDTVGIIYVADDPGSFIFEDDALFAASRRNLMFAWGLSGALVLAALAFLRSAWRARGQPAVDHVPYVLSPPDD